MARILIIDDDKSFREALAESVRDFGHDVVEASGAQEAFKLIGNVDAAFLDLKMSGISGIEFLRETKPIAPVIVLTAFADSIAIVASVLSLLSTVLPSLATYSKVSCSGTSKARSVGHFNLAPESFEKQTEELYSSMRLAICHWRCRQKFSACCRIES
jgi:CheY-like chemotaxis protein